MDKINGSKLFRNGIDRVDNSLGYILSNVVSCCKICNYMKKDLSEQEFQDQCERVYLAKDKKKSMKVGI